MGMKKPHLSSGDKPKVVEKVLRLFILNVDLYIYFFTIKLYFSESAAMMKVLKVR